MGRLSQVEAGHIIVDMDPNLFTRPANDDASDIGVDSCSNGFPERLVAAGLRPTRQRVALGELLFGGGDRQVDRHVTAERLFEEATAAQMPVSLATVYNTLHQFTAAGLLREIAVDGARVYFDTNTSEHHHFLFEDDGELFDIPASCVVAPNLPAPPEGLKIARVDVIVRLRRDNGA
jgi:Fur family iron response transcriptional regulator